jgi:hypothetical protein
MLIVRLDRRKVRARKRKLRAQLEDFRPFLPVHPNWVNIEIAIQPYGWILPLSPELMDKIASDRGWIRADLASLDPKWFYCPDLDVLLRYNGTGFTMIDRAGPDALRVTS